MGFLEKLKQRIAHRTRQVDPASFGDPLAEEIEWVPLVSGGASFTTHQLVRVGSSRIEFKPTRGALIFYLIFILIGGGSLGFFVAMLFSGKSMGGAWIVGLVGLVFFLVGIAIFRHGTTPVVIDRKLGFFWKGRIDPDKAINSSAIKHLAQLGEIHAIQLLFEHCTSKDSSYYSYEINFVLHDGRRMNVTDHGNLEKIREQASELSQFLGVPVWDAIDDSAKS